MSSDQNNNTKPVITYISDSCSSTLNSLVVYIMSKNWSHFSYYMDHKEVEFWVAKVRSIGNYGSSNVILVRRHV